MPTSRRRNAAAAALSLLLSTGTVALTSQGCEDSTPSGTEVNAGVTIAGFTASPERGAAPLTVEFEATITTEDPRAQLELTVDFGDGTATERATSFVQLPVEPNAQQLEAARRRVVLLKHTFNATGAHPVRLNVQDTTNGTDAAPINAEPATLTIVVEDQPDLVAASISAAVSQVDRLSPSVSLDYTVRNEGTAAVLDALDAPRPFDILLVLTPSPDISEPSALIASGVTLTRRSATSGLGVGEIFSENLTTPLSTEAQSLLDAGPAHLAIVVDPLNEDLPVLNVAEADESNNTLTDPQSLTWRALETAPQLTATLRVTSPFIVDAAFDAFSFDLTLTNSGDADAPPFFYDVYISPGDSTLDPETDLHFAFSAHSGRVSEELAAGANQKLTDQQYQLDTPITDVEQVYIIIALDTESEVSESNEDDNIITSDAITIQPEVVRDIDIVASDITLTPATITSGGTVEIGFTTANRGADPTGEFDCAVFLSTDATLDPDTDSFQALERGISLVPNGSETHTRSLFIGESAGDYTVFVSCDSENTLRETNETNNVAVSNTPLTVE